MKVLEIQTWIDMFDPDEINIDKVQEYLDFIKEAMDHYDPDRYSESHHILPKCFDKEDLYTSERALINGSDHYTAHMKLVECFSGDKRRRLAYALMRMKQQLITNKELTSEEFEEARKTWSKLYSEVISGENNPFFGRTHSEETRQRISTTKIGSRHTPEACKKISLATQGKNHPMYGKHHSEESRRSMSLSHLNMSDETRKRMSEAHKNKKYNLVCQVCGNTFLASGANSKKICINCKKEGL